MDLWPVFVLNIEQRQFGLSWCPQSFLFRSRARLSVMVILLLSCLKWHSIKYHALALLTWQGCTSHDSLNGTAFFFNPPHTSLLFFITLRNIYIVIKKKTSSAFTLTSNWRTSCLEMRMYRLRKRSFVTWEPNHSELFSLADNNVRKWTPVSRLSY